MQKWILAGLGFCALGALWKFEREEDGAAVAWSPLFAALAIEVGVFMLRRHQSALLRAPVEP